MANEYIEGALIGLDRILNERARKRELDRADAKRQAEIEDERRYRREEAERRFEAQKDFERFKIGLEAEQRNRQSQRLVQANQEIDNIFKSDMTPQEKQMAIGEVMGRYPDIPLKDKVNFLVNTIGFTKQVSPEVQRIADEILSSSRYEDLRNPRDPEKWEDAMTNLMEDYSEAIDKGLITEEQLNDALKITNTFGNFGDFISTYVPEEQTQSFWESLFGSRKDNIDRPSIEEPSSGLNRIVPMDTGSLREELSSPKSIVESGGIIPILGRGIKRGIRNEIASYLDDSINRKPITRPLETVKDLTGMFEFRNTDTPFTHIGTTIYMKPETGIRRVGTPNPQKNYRGEGITRVNERETGSRGSVRDTQTEERKRQFNRLWKGRVMN